MRHPGGAPRGGRVPFHEPSGRPGRRGRLRLGGRHPQDRARGRDRGAAHEPPGRRARTEALARREVDRLQPGRRQRSGRLADAVGGGRAEAAHLAAARGAGPGVDARQPERRVPLPLRRPSGGSRPEALPGGPRRIDARAAARRPGPELQLLGGRLADALRPQGQPGLLLETLQGRSVPGHLALRLHGEELQARDQLRRPQQLPDVGGRGDVLRFRPLARRRHQPLGAGSRDGRAPPGHELHRRRRDGSLDRRPAHRLRAQRLPVPAGRRRRGAAQAPGAHPFRRLAPAGPLHQPVGLHPFCRCGGGRPGDSTRGTRRRLPRRSRRQGGAAQEPHRHAGRPRGHPAALTRRQTGRLLLGRDRRVPALRPRRGDGPGDPGHERPRPQALLPELVPRREEDPVRRQGLRASRRGARHGQADEDRRVARPRQRRVHLGGERLRLVARQPLRRVLAAAREPQQRDLPLRHARGPQAPGHRRLLRELEPSLRRRRRLSLLPVLPPLRDRDGPVRGQPHRGQPGPRDGGAAAQGREAAVREAPGDRAAAHSTRGGQGRAEAGRPGPLPRGPGGPRVTSSR